MDMRKRLKGKEGAGISYLLPALVGILVV